MATLGLSVRQAATELDISPSAVRRLIADGQLRATSFAGRLVVDPEHLRQVREAGRPNGRPFSPATSWLLLRLLSGGELDEVSASRRSQLRRHLRSGDPQQLVGRLRRRASRSFWYVHPSLQGEFLTEPECVLAGRSAAEHAGADLAGRGGPAEIYLDQTAVARFARTYDADDDTAVADANVVVRVVDISQVPLLEPGVAAKPVVALDLVEAGEARAVGAGWKLWHAAIDLWREDDPHGR